jgi:hypothetical protein
MSEEVWNLSRSLSVPFVSRLVFGLNKSWSLVVSIINILLYFYSQSEMNHKELNEVLGD